MEVKFLAYTGSRGGAAKAAIRVKSLLSDKGCETAFISVEGGENKMPFYYKVIHHIFWVISYVITKLQKQKIPTKNSLNIFGSSYIKHKVKGAELLHVHWINNETLRIKDFSLLSKKSVITLHDEWFYCGAEHHALNAGSYERVVNGYLSSNKNVKGIDVNRWIWQVKRKYYPFLNGVIFTVPSSWMKSRAEKSYLLRGKDIRIVPNPINTDVFKKSTLDFIIDGINADDFVITFGAIGGGSEIKGFDLLELAIQFFSEFVVAHDKIKIITFGGLKPRRGFMCGISIIELGHISSESELAKIYSISSLTIVPSRAESFGQVAAESLSCETPVVAFNYSGLTDIVKHKENGYLADPFDARSLADGIIWFYLLSDEDRERIGMSGRQYVLEAFSEEVVGIKLISIYREMGYKKS